MNVGRRRKARILSRLHGHCRALAGRTIEHDAPIRRKLVQDTAATNALLQVRISGMKRTSDLAMAPQLAPLAQVDKGDVRPAD